MHEFMKKFASDAAIVVDSCVDLINRQDAEIKRLKALSKKASTGAEVTKSPELELDSDKLNKAASALHTMHGSPANCTPEQIANYWRTNPSSMLSLIEKMANATIEKASAKSEFGKIVEKKASAPEAKVGGKDAASDAFWSSL